MRTLKNHCFTTYLLIVLSIIIFSKDIHGQSYGLVVSSHETVAENRTSLNLTSSGEICFTRNFTLQFNMGFVANQSIYFGYIFRLVNDQNQNIDLIYNQQENKFRLVFGEDFTDIGFSPDLNYLMNDFATLKLSIDEAGKISCSYQNNQWTSKPIPLKSKCFKLIFGAVDEHGFASRDTPPMKLRNIGISIDGKEQYLWPLDEVSGDITTDRLQHKMAEVSNPSWIKPRHSNWRLLSQITVNGAASAAFDARKEVLYVTGSDSLYKLAASDNRVAAVPLTKKRSNLLIGSQSIVDSSDGELYDFYIDERALLQYEADQNKWNTDFEFSDLTQYWHANKMITHQNKLITIGGYGQLRYKNTIFSTDLATGGWDTLQPTGDFFAPRYLAGLGATAYGDSAYIIGGYGSRDGSQMLGPRYFYDFLLYDVQKNRFKKIYSLPTPKEDFVFANSLVIDQKNDSYYGLVYPKDRFKSTLQLIQGSLSKPTYKWMGQPLPYSFQDVSSFADLYYAENARMLYAVTLYTSNQHTRVAIYGINFPPNEYSSTAAMVPATPVNKNYWVYAMLGVAVVSGIAFLLYKKRSQKKPIVIHAVPKQQKENGVPVAYPLQREIHIAQDTGFKKEAPADINKLLLFGPFEAVTKDGTNITKQFTPLLKEMFLLILIDSLRYNKGVSSSKLNEILWHNKNPKDANNNRSVNLVKLKNILDKLGDFSIDRETGSWLIKYSEDSVYVDFKEYLKVFADGYQELSHESANKLLSIVESGAFLEQTHYDWLDTIKAEISNFIIEYLINYSELLNTPADAEKLIAIANAIFVFDELNEFALNLKLKTLIAIGRHTLAKTTFDKFTLKYKEIYGEELEMNYSSFIE